MIDGLVLAGFGVDKEGENLSTVPIGWGPLPEGVGGRSSQNIASDVGG